MNRSTDPELIAETLRAAADLIAAEGHTKGTGHDENGWCMYGAIGYIIGDTLSVMRLSSLYTNFWGQCVTVLNKEYGWSAGHPTPMDWNDLPETTKEDVIDFLLHAAKRAENPQ